MNERPVPQPGDLDYTDATPVQPELAAPQEGPIPPGAVRIRGPKASVQKLGPQGLNHMLRGSRPQRRRAEKLLKQYGLRAE
jgi:hypothetical protein